VLAHDRVSNLSNLVDEYDDILLEHLRASREVVDETETKDGKRHVSRNHWVQVTSRRHIRSDNGGTRLTKSKGEQSPNFLDGLLEKARLNVFISLLSDRNGL